MTHHPHRRPRRPKLRAWATAGAVAVVAAVGGALALGAQSGTRAYAADSSTTKAPPRRPTEPQGVYFSPQTLQRIYGVAPLLAKGIDGRGETVVLPEQPVSRSSTATDPGGIRRDLAAFDERFHLPAANLAISRAPGYTGETSDPGIEGALDAEMVHTIAPGAKIDVMFFGPPPPFTPPDLGAVMRAAAARGAVVSASFGRCERCESAEQLRSLTRALRYARDRHVTVIAASGDSGAANTTNTATPIPTRGVNLPCSDPLVTCVGGTTLSANYAQGTYKSESAWNSGHRLPLGGATGGGVSALYARPDYQDGLPVIGARRGVPDLAAVASGKSLDVITIQHGRPINQPVGGTSAAAPLWAGIAAPADQNAHRQLGFLNDGLYRIGHSSQYHHAFHDITHDDSDGLQRQYHRDSRVRRRSHFNG